MPLLMLPVATRLLGLSVYWSLHTEQLILMCITFELFNCDVFHTSSASLCVKCQIRLILNHEDCVSEWDCV